jgi:hypothetical protein
MQELTERWPSLAKTLRQNRLLLAALRKPHSAKPIPPGRITPYPLICSASQRYLQMRYDFGKVMSEMMLED